MKNASQEDKDAYERDRTARQDRGSVVSSHFNDGSTIAGSHQDVANLNELRVFEDILEDKEDRSWDSNYQRYPFIREEEATEPAIQFEISSVQFR